MYEDSLTQINSVLKDLLSRIDLSTNPKVKALRSPIESFIGRTDYNGLLDELNKLNSAESNFSMNEIKQVNGILKLQRIAQNPELDVYCIDFGLFTEFKDHILKPHFEYRRKVSKDPIEKQILAIKTNVQPIPETSKFDFELVSNGLTNGALLWLYFYERMGIFKILGALMDDYNYRGKYTISGKLKDTTTGQSNYNNLMDAICTLYRLGIGSNLRDRIATYQRSLGVAIESNLNVETEKNAGFMQTFNKLIGYMLDYYKAKQLADAIQSQNGSNQSRSSVATQTSIRDTLNVLRQQLEPFEYGRNQINTFIGIATVHATISLVRMLKDEIGIPRQYDRPEEFIPAAYGILVEKNATTLNDTNRFIIYDNCASYGYRLLTDIERADLTQFKPVSTNSALDLWLDDIEGIVEGYNNAFKSVSEPASAIV